MDYSEPPQKLQQPTMLGQIPLPFYNQMILGFTISDDEDVDFVVITLQDQSKALAAKFPFLAGKVVLEGKNNESSGTYKVVADPDREIVQLKDSKGQFPPYADILKANAVGPIMNGYALTAYRGLPPSHEPTASGLPIWILQVKVQTGSRRNAAVLVMHASIA